MASEATLEELQAENQSIIEHLQVDGYGFESDQLLKLRVDLVTDVLIEMGVIAADALELRWELLMSDVLESATSEIDRQKQEVHEFNEQKLAEYPKLDLL